MDISVILSLKEAFNDQLMEEFDQGDDLCRLKKRIKYCRNPMEKKQLQRKLNEAYKEQKIRRNKV